MKQKFTSLTSTGMSHCFACPANNLFWLCVLLHGINRVLSKFCVEKAAEAEFCWSILCLHCMDEELRLKFMFGFPHSCAIFTNLYLSWEGKTPYSFFYSLDCCKSDRQDIMMKQSRNLFCSFFIWLLPFWNFLSLENVCIKSNCILKKEATSFSWS